MKEPMGFIEMIHVRSNPYLQMDLRDRNTVKKKIPQICIPHWVLERKLSV
jgi:hypothetical protein